MFQPNTTGVISRQAGMDVYGQPTWKRGTIVPCAVVKLTPQIKKTAVRADSSASRGSADEDVTVGTILFPATVAPGKGDRFDIAGVKLRIIMAEPRFAVTGKIDHYECSCEAMP